MTSSHPDAHSPARKYDQLRAAYAHRLKDFAAAFDNILSQRDLRPLGRADILRAQQLIHRLSGSGTTFGFPDITIAAQKAEMMSQGISAAMKDDDTINDQSFAELRDAMLDLRRLCVFHATGDAAGDFQAARQAAVPAPSGPRVLVVDDDEDIRALIEVKLNLRGMDVDMASDGAAAMEMLAQRHYDMIILDVSMAGVDGQETLRRIKQNPDYLRIPVLMLTGSTRENDIVHALHAGAMEYIFKPFDPDQLAAKVQRILSVPQITVMIVDDDSMILDLLESMYQDKGFTVLRASGGSQALKIMETSTPNLIILDRQMPDMNGADVLRDIRRKPGMSDVPVIVLSGMARDASVSEGLSEGAGIYMTKPFLPEKLLEASVDLLEKRGVFLD